MLFMELKRGRQGKHQEQASMLRLLKSVTHLKFLIDFDGFAASVCKTLLSMLIFLKKYIILF